MKRWLTWFVAALLLGSACFPASAAAQELVIAESDVEDPFGRLRSARRTPDAAYWYGVGEALAGLETLEAAAYDPVRGVVTLHGKPASGRGPYHLDDLMTALRAVFLHPEAPGVTIDPDPADPRGPRQHVRYFAGCEDTAFGWVMFEADRLLKCLSAGRDNFSGSPIDADVEQFHNMLELRTAMSDKRDGGRNRFWLTLDLEDPPPPGRQRRRHNGYEPVLCSTPDKQAVSIAHCRVFLRTQVMELRDGKLVDAPGKKDAAAQRFAAHFSNHFDEFAGQFPELRRVEQLSRLVVLATWMRDADIPVDVEFLQNYQQLVPVQTPRETPARRSSIDQSRRTGGGTERITIQSFGGVQLRPSAFYAGDANNKAQQHQQAAARAVEEKPSQVSLDAEINGRDFRLVVLPTSRTQLQPRSEVRAQPARFAEQGDSSPSVEAILPSGPESLAETQRRQEVQRVRMELPALDQLRENIRGPPTGDVALVDGRHLSEDARAQLVGVERVQLKRPSARRSAPIRGPPDPLVTSNAEKTDEEAILPSGPESLAETRRRQEVQRVPMGLSALDQLRENIRGPPDADVIMEDGRYPSQDERAQSIGVERIPLKPSSGRPNAPIRGPPDPLLTATAERTQAVGREPLPLGGSTRNRPTPRYGLPIFQGESDSPTLNLPKLVHYKQPGRTRSTSIEGRPGTEIVVADQLQLRSELRDIMVPFGEPQIDQSRTAIFYPVDAPTAGDAQTPPGFYPQTMTLEFRDGMHIQFRKNGHPQVVAMPDGTTFTFGGGPEDGWPRPTWCRIDSTNSQTPSGTYRLVRRMTRTEPKGGDDSQEQSNQEPEKRLSSLQGETEADGVERPSSGGATASEMAGQPPQSPDTAVPLQTRPAPEKAEVRRIGTSQITASAVPVRDPILLRGTTHQCTWSATLRAVDADVEPGMELVFSNNDASALRVSLDSYEGTVAPGKRQQIRLLVSRDAAAEAKPKTGTFDLFVDVDVAWSSGQQTTNDQISIPIRLIVEPARSSGVAIAAILIGIGSLAAVLVTACIRNTSTA